jgi:glucose-6-phosphate 1-dehydrogenase
MIFSFNNESLTRHKVSQREVLEALADPFKIEIETDEHQGNPTSMWIGKTFAERLIEINIEYLEDSNHIFHAAKARSSYVRKYERSL